ncbi:MAG: BREX-1 system phosphatase PglZ type B [Casimicrobiaceae bacterium]
MSTQTSPQTLLDALQLSFAVALRSPEGVAEPIALLWTDADGQWRPLVPVLRNLLPQIYVLGNYDSANHVGPAIWLKCIVDRTLTEVVPPAGTVPILYLPGVSRQDLRAGGDCPAPAQPLIELQYRGALWHQRNGRDWTVEAFLSSEDGVGLDIALDNRTREAVMRALPVLASEPLAPLRGRRLDADDFDRLSVGDPVRDLLGWMSEPEPFQGRCDPARWETFRNICVREFGFDPDKDGPARAGDLMLNGNGKWEAVWRRFHDAPRGYPGIAELLRNAKPRDLLVDRARQPQVNQEQEAHLRYALEAALVLPHEEICDRILKLEADNRDRRSWVWAELGYSTMAHALEPLSRLAALARSPLGGVSLVAMAADYAADGWRCDRAALDSMNHAKSPSDNAFIADVVQALYAPWLDKSARKFQELATQNSAEYRRLVTGVDAKPETCVVFADGLRFDVAGILRERLEQRGLRVKLAHRIAPLPTVTATAKPVASPAHSACEGGASSEDFNPVLSTSKQSVNASRLRDEMARQGVEILDPEETTLAEKTDKGGWTEIGRLDEMGHSLGILLVRHIDDEVEAIADRVSALLGAGWTRVRVVTDHGWLLVPRGLPKVELPAHLVATKWARCASVRGESTPTVPVFPWHWNPQARIASPPGIGSFIVNTEYAHGGVSLQECVVPEMLVERGAVSVKAQITEISWRGMRCRVIVETSAVGLRVELRRNWKQADPEGQRIAVAKDLGSNGHASLAVERDEYEGTAAMAVILDGTGRVLDYRATTIGEEQ